MYPDTYHGFDAEEWIKGTTLEGMNGVQYRLLYNKQAHENAVDRVGEFLRTHLGTIRKSDNSNEYIAETSIRKLLSSLEKADDHGLGKNFRLLPRTDIIQFLL